MLRFSTFSRRLLPARLSPRHRSIVCTVCLAVTLLLGIRMHLSRYLPAAALLGVPALAQHHGAEDPFKVYTISADNITAKLIPYGARLTSLLVPDRNGDVQDIVVGFDDPKQYRANDLGDHNYFGPVVGRYGELLPYTTSN